AEPSNPKPAGERGTQASSRRAAPAPKVTAPLEKLLLAPEYPRNRGDMALGPKDRVYIASGSAYYVYDSDGTFESRMPVVGRAYDYDGKLTGAVPGVAGIAVFPDGRIAVGDPDRKHIDVYDDRLALKKRLDADDEDDLEVDASGRLLATLADPTILFTRWSAN